MVLFSNDTAEVIRVNQYILFALLCTAFAMLTVFCLAIVVYGRRLSADMKRADTIRAAIVENCDANMKLVKLMQGWSVVIANDKTKEAKVAEKATNEVKDEMSCIKTKIDEVPAKVVDQIQHMPPSESGMMPVPMINPAI